MRSLVLLSLCFWWSYARLSETHHKRKLELKQLEQKFLNEPVGKSVTLNCPISPSVAKMYRYLRRIKSGKKLEFARRQMVSLLGVRYKWYKDGKAIRHHRSAWFMKLESVKLEDTGMYTCKVVMAKDGSSRNFILNVFEKSKSGRPKIESELKNITLRAGESTTLRCISTNTRKRPQINWLKWKEPSELSRLQDLQLNPNAIKMETLSIDLKQNGVASSSIRPRIRHGEKSYEFRLKLENLQEKDSGVYVCLVRNKYGSDYRSSFVQVKSMKGVAPYPIHKRLVRKFLIFPAFSTARLRCYATGDNPLTYQWYKNGKKFFHRRLGRKVNSTTSILRIRNLLPSDSGLYTCRASNPYGVFEHNITLKVFPRISSAPILLKDYPKNVTTSLGKTVTFECIELISDPMPDYRWYKWYSVPAGYPKLDVQNTSQYTEVNKIYYTPMEVKIGNNNRYGGRLTLTNITEDDIGLYSCVLRNQFGMDYASAFLHWKIDEGPKFVSALRPAVIEIPQTKPLELDCETIGDPKPNIAWFRNGRPLAQTLGVDVSNYTLTLQKLLPEHSGNYSCHVNNSWGSINRTFDVRIKESLFMRPIILPSAKKVLRSGGRYEMKCTIVSTEPLTVSITKNLGTKVKESKTLTTKAKPVKLDKSIYQYSYVIRNATIKDNGNYSCVARNAIGESNRNFQIQVVT